MSSIHVKRGDTVIVLAGKDKGKTGRILAANPTAHRVQVENVNVITRHKKARNAQETGGRIEDAGFIDSSNVMVVCPSCSKPTRISHKDIDGKKVRACKHCGVSLDDQKLDKKGKKKDSKKESKKDSVTKKVETKPKDKKTEVVAKDNVATKAKPKDKKIEKKADKKNDVKA